MARLRVSEAITLRLRKVRSPTRKGVEMWGLAVDCVGDIVLADTRLLAQAKFYRHDGPYSG